MPYIKCNTPAQQRALEELKNSMKNELTSPTMFDDNGLFYKFLKAKDFNIDEAKKLLRKHIIWRKVYEVDRILETFKPKEVFVKYVEPSVVGFDKDGDIVTYIASGRISNAELFKCIKLNDCMKHWIWFAEKQTSLNKNQNQSKNKDVKAPVSLIVDLDKLEFSNAASKITAVYLLRLSRLIRENYSERLKAAYIINAPSFYVVGFSIIKTVLSSVITQRIHVYGNSGWKEKFLKNIDADVLPVFLGGKRTDPDGDPYCKSFMTIPGKIRVSYYLTEEERYFEDPSKVTSVIILPYEKKEISFKINELGSTFQWKFMCRNGTIIFGLFFEESKEEMKEIIPFYEYDTSDGTEENSHTCSFTGKYIVVFDNSRSRFTSKEVQFIIHVQKPEI